MIPLISRNLELFENLYLVFPVYREQAIVSEVFKRIVEILDACSRCRVVFVTTGAEDNRANQPSTKSLIELEISKSKFGTDRMLLLQRPGRSSSKSLQLNYFLFNSQVGGKLGREDYVWCFDFDAKIEITHVEEAQILIERIKPDFIQQIPLVLDFNEDMRRPNVSFFGFSEGILHYSRAWGFERRVFYNLQRGRYWGGHTMGASMVFNADLIKSVGGFPQGSDDDLALLNGLLEKQGKIALLSQPILVEPVKSLAELHSQNVRIVIGTMLAFRQYFVDLLQNRSRISLISFLYSFCNLFDLTAYGLALLVLAFDGRWIALGFFMVSQGVRALFLQKRARLFWISPNPNRLRVLFLWFYAFFRPVLRFFAFMVALTTFQPSKSIRVRLSA